MQDYGKAQCLCESSDGRYLFIGLPDGLSVINAGSQLPVGSWEKSDAEIVLIKACLIGVQTYLVAAIDSNCKFVNACLYGTMENIH